MKCFFLLDSPVDSFFYQIQGSDNDGIRSSACTVIWRLHGIKLMHLIRLNIPYFLLIYSTHMERGLTMAVLVQSNFEW